MGRAADLNKVIQFSMLCPRRKYVAKLPTSTDGDELPLKQDLEAQCCDLPQEDSKHVNHRVRLDSSSNNNNSDNSIAESEDQEKLPLVLILVGRVGVGKSSTANNILGPANEAFVARRAASAVTRECQIGASTV